MKSYTDYVWLNTAERRELINITQEVSQRVRQSGIGEGVCQERVQVHPDWP